jgi:hypothetical protein
VRRFYNVDLNGRDENGDQGRDAAPYSNVAVKPSPGKPDNPEPNSKLK